MMFAKQMNNIRLIGKPRRGPMVVRAATHSATFADRRRLQTKLQEMTQEQRRQPRPENVEGDFYVDEGCIDCQACRWVAPETFSAAGIQAAVNHQPQTKEERVRALQALLSCPVYAIHARSRDPSELKEAQRGLPRPWPTEAPGVYHCGWHSERSFGGAGWLITGRPEGRGNVMVDSPRYSAVLAKQVEELGGIEYIFLTHKDDVADHDKWAAHFGAKRILHEREATEHQGTDKCEVLLEGEGPWAFPDGGEDLTVVFTPGHTNAHCCLYSAPNKAIFAGDHLSGVEGGDRTCWQLNGRLFIYDQFNWFSVPEQLRSVQKLLEYDWLHVLPGHGLPASVKDASERLRAVGELVASYGDLVESRV